MGRIRVEDQQKAKKLRAKGWTLPEIAAEVKAGKGLVSLWVRDVEIGAKGLKRLADRKLRVNGLVNARTAWSEQRKAAREVFREEGRKAARLGDINHAVACSLYWAEGSKRKNCAQIVNGDVKVLLSFLNFCRSSFNLKDEDICYMVSAYTNVKSKKEILDYWVNHLKLNGGVERVHKFDDFRYITRGVSGNKIGKMPYGTCTITLKCSTRIVQHIYGALEVYGGTIIDPKK